jgi:hypothetical protein
MEAAPEVGDAYRQEFFLGDAEDLGEILSTTGSEETPAASCDGDCVVTKDFTPIEPGHIEHKYYALGVGLILELDPESGERIELVEFEIPEGAASPAVGAGRLSIDPAAHPNPLRSESAFRFELTEPGDVSADVFDSSGRRVRALARGPYAAGSHSIRWDGRDSGNRRVAAGIYFVRVRAGGEKVSSKVFVVR